MGGSAKNAFAAQTLYLRRLEFVNTIDMGAGRRGSSFDLVGNEIPSTFFVVVGQLGKNGNRFFFFYIGYTASYGTQIRTDRNRQ